MLCFCLFLVHKFVTDSAAVKPENGGEIVMTFQAFIMYKVKLLLPIWIESKFSDTRDCKKHIKCRAKGKNEQKRVVTWTKTTFCSGCVWVDRPIFYIFTFCVAYTSHLGLSHLCFKLLEFLLFILIGVQIPGCFCPRWWRHFIERDAGFWRRHVRLPPASAVVDNNVWLFLFFPLYKAHWLLLINTEANNSLVLYLLLVNYIHTYIHLHGDSQT